jgi:hypothetical protein
MVTPVAPSTSNITRRRAEDRHARLGQGGQGGRKPRISIYPLEHDRLYTVGELREAGAMLLADRQADQDLSSRLRVQDRNVGSGNERT